MNKITTRKQHQSCNGIDANIQGSIQEANHADIVVFTNGRGIRAVINDQTYLNIISTQNHKLLRQSVPAL